MHSVAAWRCGAMVAIVLASTPACSQTTYRWIDPKTGSTVISDQAPPPGAKRATQSAASSSPSPSEGEAQALPYASRRASEKFPVVLYTSAGCTVCSQARRLLESRAVPFVERVIKSEDELAELDKQLGGDSALPSVKVGRQSARSFVPSTWNELLDFAGYPAAAPYRQKPATVPSE